MHFAVTNAIPRSRSRSMKRVPPGACRPSPTDEEGRLRNFHRLTSPRKNKHFDIRRNRRRLSHFNSATADSTKALSFCLVCPRFLFVPLASSGGARPCQKANVINGGRVLPRTTKKNLRWRLTPELLGMMDEII